MVANGSEPREILLDPMIAGSRGADGCEFDLAVHRECTQRMRAAARQVQRQRGGSSVVSQAGEQGGEQHNK